jgi:hypothetical protein
VIDSKLCVRKLHKLVMNKFVATSEIDVHG